MLGCRILVRITQEINKDERRYLVRIHDAQVKDSINLQSYVVCRCRSKREKEESRASRSQSALSPKRWISSNHFLMASEHPCYPAPLTESHSRLLRHIDDNFLETLHISDPV